MKTFKTIGLIVSLVLLGSVSLYAASSKEKLIGTLQREQKASEKKIVYLWEHNKRGAELKKVLSDYSVREIRLQTMMGNSRTHSLLSVLINKGKGKFKTPNDLAAAIVREYYLKKGIDLDQRSFIEGEYLIRKSTMRKSNYSNYEWKD